MHIKGDKEIKDYQMLSIMTNVLADNILTYKTKHVILEWQTISQLESSSSVNTI